MPEQVPMDDVQEMWNDLGDNKTWGALADEAAAHKDKTEGISDAVVDSIQNMAQDMDNKSMPFPSNPQELYDALNGKMGDQGMGGEEGM